MATIVQLDSYDYVVIVVLVVLSSLIGVYHSIKARKAKNASEFLVSSPTMGILPVILSAVASQTNATGILGTSGEIYKHGIVFMEVLLAALIIVPLGTHLYLPVFYNVKSNGIFQYLEYRFNKVMRYGAAVIDTMCRMLITSISLYAPAVALNQVTGLDVWTSVSFMGIICICYTSMGGIKAVIWTDVAQLVVMTGVLVTILVKSSYGVGGLEGMWEKCTEGGRTDFIPTNDNLYSPWTTVFGCIFNFLSMFITNQMFMQRYMSKKNLRFARLSYTGCTVGFAIFIFVNTFNGLFMYARYHNCDPMTTGEVNTIDQIMALFAMETLSFFKGLPGVFVAGLLCATLSTLSSLLNAMVVVTIEDFVRPVKPNLTENAIMRLSKILVIFYGALAIALVALAEAIPGVMQATFSFQGMLIGPLLGVFTAGMLLPWITNGGAIVGYLAAVGVTGWATFGIMVTKTKLHTLPFSVSECNSSFFGNGTIWEASTSIAESGNATILLPDETFPLYLFSPLWYCCWSCGIIIVVGLLWSLLFGFRNPEEVDPHLLFPFVSQLLAHLPKPILRLIGYQTNIKEYFKRFSFGAEEKELEIISFKEVNSGLNTKVSDEPEKSTLLNVVPS